MDNPARGAMFCSGSFRALEDALWREVGDVRAREALTPVVVVVPTNLLRRHLALAGAERGGFFNIHLLTLIDLASRLGAVEMAARGLGPMPHPGEEVIARGVCRREDAGYFRPIADRPGFYRALLATITDLKESSARPEGLAAAAGKLAGRDAPLARKLGDLARLWAAYEERLRALGFHDDADLLAAGAEAAPASKWLDGAAAVFVYGFYDLNPLQQRLVDAATSGRHAGVFFPYEATAAFGFAEPTFEWFQELGFEPVELPPERGGELWNFQRRLFAPPSGEPTAEGCVEIISAPDETAEVRALLRKVAALAREGQPLPRVGVLVRQGEVYAPLFREECVLGGLEAYHHEPPPLSRSRSGRSFLMLLDLLASDLGRAEVMDFLTYADLEVGDACPSDWDPLSLEAGVIKGAASWRSRLAALRVRLQTSGPDDEPEKAEARGVRLDHLAAFEALVEKLLALVEGVPREAGWGEMVAGTTGAFRELVRPSDERELVVEAVAELAALETTGEPAPLDVFTSLASRQLERCHAGRASFGACGPVVVGLMEGRGLPFDVVLVPGLVERAFPPPAVPDPLLPDGEREELAGLGMRLALKRERVAEERVLFRLAVGAAARRVVLSYARLDALSGRERVPSHFLLRAVEAATGRPCDYEGLERFPGHERLSASAFAPARPEDSWRTGEYDLAATLAAALAGRGREAAFLGEVVETAPWALRAEAARWGERVFTPYDGVLSEAAPLRRLLGRPPLRVSPTALEEYADCPFRFLLSKVLRIEAIEEPEPIQRLSGLDRGRLLHEALRRAAGRAQAAGRRPLADEETVVGAAEEVFKEFEREGVVACAMLWRLERRELLVELRRLVLAEAEEREFVPTHFEVSFGMPPGDPAGVALDLGGGLSIRLRGRIDRIDVHEASGAARVVDYKSGKMREANKDDSLAGGSALQLPLYLMAAGRLFPGHEVADAAYWFITRRGGYGRVRFGAQALRERREELLGALCTIVEGITTGRFFPAQDKDACGYCDFRLVCGAWSHVLSERKAQDEAARDYLVMRTLA